VGNVPPRSIEVISQTWNTYDYKIGINKYPGNAGEISSYKNKNVKLSLCLIKQYTLKTCAVGGIATHILK
jgi:hypothetical protein